MKVRGIFLILGAATIVVAVAARLNDRWPTGFWNQPAAPAAFDSPSVNPLVSDTGGGTDINAGQSVGSDTDQDNLSDELETTVYFTDPSVPDTDGDSLSDGMEVSAYRTDPLGPDTDRDGRPDGWEVNNSANPLSSDSWRFDFTVGQAKTSHPRTVNGLRVTDDRAQTLAVIPWLELSNVGNYRPPARNRKLLDIAKRGIVAWAAAGASHVGMVGNATWMVDDDPAMPGYQNKVISDLAKIGRENNIKVIFGVKLLSFVTSWNQFFEPAAISTNSFRRMADLMNKVMAYTGTREWIIESESPLNQLRDAYVAGLTDLTPADLIAFKANVALLESSGLDFIHFSDPFLSVKTNGAFYSPPNPRSHSSALSYIYSLIFQAISEVLQEKLSSIGFKSAYSPVSGTKTIPFLPDHLAVFRGLQTIGAYQHGQSFFMHRPYAHEYPAGNPNWVEIERGPAEAMIDLPYFFGYALNNDTFADLTFDRLFIYPAQDQFDLVGQGMADYLNRGWRVVISPTDIATKEGQKVTVTWHSQQPPPAGYNLSLLYYENCEPGTANCSVKDIAALVKGPEIKISPKRNRLALIWRPSYSLVSAGLSKYFWFELQVVDAGGAIFKYPIRIKVDDKTGTDEVASNNLGDAPISSAVPLATARPSPPDDIPSCSADWQCGAWSACVNDLETRTCADLNQCDSARDKPEESRSCVTLLAGGGGNNNGGGGGSGSSSIRPVASPPPPIISSSPPAVETCLTLTPRRFPALTGPFGFGMRNERVRLLQQMLATDQRLAPAIAVTGIYDNPTVDRVRTFQRLEGIANRGTIESTGYGLAGPRTRGKLNQIYAERTALAPCVAANTGTSGQLEQRLLFLRQLLFQLLRLLQLHLLAS